MEKERPSLGPYMNSWRSNPTEFLTLSSRAHNAMWFTSKIIGNLGWVQAAAHFRKEFGIHHSGSLNDSDEGTYIDKVSVCESKNSWRSNPTEFLNAQKKSTQCHVVKQYDKHSLLSANWAGCTFPQGIRNTSLWIIQRL